MAEELPVLLHGNRESVIRCYFPFLPPRGSKSILDIGCGRTAPYRGILEHRTEKYVSCDIRDGPKVDYVVDITTRTPFKDQEFEWGWCTEVLEHLPPPMMGTAMVELLRIVRHLVVTFPQPPHPTFYGDPGHHIIDFDFNVFSSTHYVVWKVLSTGRHIITFRRKIGS